MLNNLHEGDLFNIIAYDSEVESFRPELQRFDDETRQAALGFVEGIYAGGSTNIDGALRTALGQLQDPERPTYIVFLTDGMPTAGETNEQKIIAAAKEENKVHARIFVFGVGYDVNARFLDKLAPRELRPERIRAAQRGHRGARGQALQAHPVAGADRPAAGIRLRRNPRRGRASRSTASIPRIRFDLFAGEQLVVVGRYKKAGAAKVDRRGTVGDQRSRSSTSPPPLPSRARTTANAFIEKLWAIRRVGEILDELDLQGKNDELVNELVELSKRHGILTPYTSFMADEKRNLHDMA